MKSNQTDINTEMSLAKVFSVKVHYSKSSDLKEITIKEGETKIIVHGKDIIVFRMINGKVRSAILDKKKKKLVSCEGEI